MSKKILISPGYGAGWSTWNDGKIREYMLTYQPIIDFLESGGKFSYEECHEKGKIHPLLVLLQTDVKLKFDEDHVCILGAVDLIVETVDAPFRIREYDGAEHVEYQHVVDWQYP